MKAIISSLFILLLFSCIPNSKASGTKSSSPSGDGFFPPNHPYIKYFGRIQYADSSEAVFAFPGVNIRFAFKGTQASLLMKDLTDAGIQADGEPAQNFFNVYIDNNAPFILPLLQGDSIYELARNLPNEKHTVKLVKRTESLAGRVAFQGIQLDKKAVLFELPEQELKIEFIGNSITCGYGVEAESKRDPFSCSTENVSLSYAVLAAEKLDAEYSIVAFSGRGISQNYDRSRDNTMRDIWHRVIASQSESLWDHSQFVPDIVVINLGSNDFFSRTIDTSLFRSAYENFLTEVRNTYDPETKIVCLIGPMLNNEFPENSLDIARTIIGSIVEGFQNDMDTNIEAYELSSQTGYYGYGADWHPSKGQQQKNSKELIDIIIAITSESK